MAQLNFSPEDKLLLYCARLNPSDAVINKIKGILAEHIDWKKVITDSMTQGISPLVYWNLNKIDGGKRVPAQAMANLRNIYYGTLARNVLLYNELYKILNVFNRLGIDAVVLKGAFLAEVIYKNIGLRPMSDIDLLIKKEDLQRAKTGMAELGYCSPIFPSELHEKLHITWSEELQFKEKNKKITIEIHWDIQPVQSHFKMDISKLWENVKPVNINGIESLMLAPEDNLLHLCLHLDKHLSSGTAPSATPLRDYCGIAEIISHYKKTINWNYLLQSSRNYGIEEPIYQGLSIACRCFGAFVPTDVLRELKSADFSVDFRNIFKTKREAALMKRETPNNISYIMRIFKVNGFRNTALILLADVFPCKAYMMQRYQILDNRRIYEYYLVRFAAAVHVVLNILWYLPYYIFNYH